MSDKDPFLSRWSRRKTEARSGGEEPAEPVAAPPGPPPVAADARPVAANEPPPSLESLTPDSDFRAFMNPEVDEGLKRKALKTLFSDPRFNVMDGLDVYIDDYSKPDPMPESWLGKLNQMARLGAYQEPVPDAGGEGAQGMPPKASETPPGEPEKLESNQEPAEEPSSTASDTASAPIQPPRVPE